MASVVTAAPTDGASLLALYKLHKRFGATHALKAVDLTFEQGKFHAIVGENGAGKSTLIKLLTGVYPRSSGEVFWRGTPVTLPTSSRRSAWTSAPRRKSIGCWPPHSRRARASS